MVDANWRKSHRSVAGGQCVEVASTRATIMVRDSTDPSGPKVRYPVQAWQTFVAAVKARQRRLPHPRASKQEE